jgi:hypothetical protein
MVLFKTQAQPLWYSLKTQAHLRPIVGLILAYSWLSFFFLDMSTQEMGEEIWTSDLRFIRRSPQPIELPFRNQLAQFFFFLAFVVLFKTQVHCSL